MSVRKFHSKHLDAEIPGIDAEISQRIRQVAKVAVEKKGLQDLSPIVLNDDLTINRTLTSFGAAQMAGSPLTAERYAQEAEVFERYLKLIRRKDLADLDRDDFITYKAYRTEGPIKRVKPRTWRRLAAITLKLAEHVGRKPANLTYRKLRGPRGNDRVRMVDLHTYLKFQEIGLGGSRDRDRDTACAELLVTSGLRITESTALLVHELPRHDSFEDDAFVDFTLPHTIAKGGVSRDVQYTRRVANSFIRPYLEGERANRVEQFIRAKFPDRNYSRAQLAANVQYLFFERQGDLANTLTKGEWKRRQFHEFTQDERSRLIEVKGSIAHFEVVDIGALWISEQNTPMDRFAWSRVFGRANDRMGIKAKTQRIGPHRLRHTYAVYYLTFQIRAFLKLTQRPRRPQGNIEDLILGNPLWNLQARLGHASPFTTAKYLTYYNSHKEACGRRSDEWAVAFAQAA